MLNELRRSVKLKCWDLYEHELHDKSITREDIIDLTNQLVALLIVRYYQNATELKRPIYSFSSGKSIANNTDTSNDYKTVQRRWDKWGDKNKAFRQEIRAQGFQVPEFPVLESNRKGWLISPLNSRELENLSHSPISVLVENLDNRRISSIKKISHDEFVREFEDYEQWCSTLPGDSPNEETLLRILDFFVLQEKLPIDLYVQVATYMEKNNIEKFPLERASIFWDNIFWPPMLILEANQVLYYERAIPIVFTAIECLYAESTRKWTSLRYLQASVLKHFEIQGTYETMYKNLKVEEALDFFKCNYNMLEHRKRSDFGTQKNPNKKLINLFRQVWGQYRDPYALAPSAAAI